jgi:hypothetical protein
MKARTLRDARGVIGYGCIRVGLSAKTADCGRHAKERVLPDGIRGCQRRLDWLTTRQGARLALGHNVVNVDARCSMNGHTSGR